MIGIIDYGMGNLLSVKNAVEFLGYDAEYVSVNSNFNDFEKIILPGVGAFPNCMKNLNENGFSDLLNLHVIQNRKPILGICLGMQVMANFGLENGKTEGLGWFDGIVQKMNVSDSNLRIPHVGWANIETKDHFIFEGLRKNTDFYFVHSYHIECNNKNNVIATINHGNVFTAAIAKDNIIGCQFHPEKSQEAGLVVLKNFITKKF